MQETVGILVYGDNHFIVQGPLPGRETAQALAQHWSIINIAAPTPAPLQKWRIITHEFRENLTWAVSIPGDTDISPAVRQLLAELSSRGIPIHDAAQAIW